MGEHRSDEGGIRQRTLLCGSWGQEVQIGGDSEVFGDNDQQVMAGYNKKRSGLGLGRLQGL